MWLSLLLISTGAALGALARWGLGLLLTPFTNNLHIGTLALGNLAANWLGCFLMGIILALFWQQPSIPESWRLFLVTGFLGSLTTFSAFSAEIMQNLWQQHFFATLASLSLHLFGGLCSTLLGIILAQLFL